MIFLANYEMPQKKESRNLSLLCYFVIERNIRMQTTRLRAIITVRIMAPHLQTIKMTEIAWHPLLFNNYLRRFCHTHYKKSLLNFSSTIIVQWKWKDKSMAKCQRQFGNELLSNSTTASKRDLGPVSRKYSEVLVIWVRRLSESSFSSVCTSFLTLITKLQSHSAWVSSGFRVLVR